MTAAILFLAAGTLCFSTSCSLTSTIGASAVDSWERALALPRLLMPSDADLVCLHSCSMEAGLSYKDLPPCTITELPPDAAVRDCHVPLTTVSPHERAPSYSPPEQDTNRQQQQQQAAKGRRIEEAQAAHSRAQEQARADARAAMKALALAQRQKEVARQQEEQQFQTLKERAAMLERKKCQAMEDRLQQERMEEQQRKAAAK